MNNIIGNKIGNTVNVMIDGKMHSRKYKKPEEAKEMFTAVLEANSNPTKENVEKVHYLLNKTNFLLKGDFLFFDDETENYYIKGVDQSIPDLLGEAIDEHIEEGWPLDYLKNFGTLLMQNPDPVVRKDLFDFIQTHDFTITDKGYMVVYKAVTHKKKVDNDLATFIGKAVVTAKKYKKAPKVYCVYEKEDGELAMTLETTYNRWVENGKVEENNLTLKGNLAKLYDGIADLDDGTVFTDKHTQTMDIRLGVPVVMDRTECDNNPTNECSYGLHVGATKYVESFGYGDDTNLLCLVNPAHVVAVPNYDRSKMRVSEYYPYGIVGKDKNGKLKKVEQSYFETDYGVLEKKQLEDALADVEDGDTSPEVQAMKIRVLEL